MQALRLLDGIIDIYQPDIKYSDDNEAREYSKEKDYVRNSRQAIMEMKRQVGNLVVDDGICCQRFNNKAPCPANDMCRSKESLRFISDEIGKKTFISVMSQYFPTNRAGVFRSFQCP